MFQVKVINCTNGALGPGGDVSPLIERSERLNVTCTSNGRWEFVPRDQVSHVTWSRHVTMFLHIN